MIEGILSDYVTFFWGVILLFGGLLSGLVFAAKKKMKKIESYLTGLFTASSIMWLGGFIHPFAIKLQGHDSWIAHPEHSKQIGIVAAVSGVFLVVIYISDTYINRIR